MSGHRNKALPRRSARVFLSTGQKITLALGLFAVLVGLVLFTTGTLQVLVDISLTFYGCIMLLKAVLFVASLQVRGSSPATPPLSINDPDLPTYTALVPLYREAQILPALVYNLSQLQYPKHRLQVLLLLEEDDTETLLEAQIMDLPDNFEIIVAPGIPQGQARMNQPKGKPRALNIGLARATGVFSVIYDAEDRPDPDQLLKAVAEFRKDQKGTVACVQARLQFWNEDTSWVTRFYWAEYVVHFVYNLAGLAKLNLVPPLGGTSNHFRTEVLRKIAFPQSEFPALPGGTDAAYGWDSYNVTEDAELAGALAMYGYDIKIIDSVTYEEATSRVRVADGQRRRWLKGYLQTGLVYTRQPVRTARQMGPVKWFCFNLLMLGTPFSLMLNPIYWGLTIAYFVTRVAGYTDGSQAIEQLFPTPVFYTGVALLLVGNLLLFLQLVTACLDREGYGSVKYMLLAPFWWIFTSWSAYRVLFELARRKTRYTWHKTEHGHDILKESEVRLETTRKNTLDTV